jgi:hypothetical protein
MHPASIQTVCQQVYARFPNLRGVRPKVERQQLPGSTDPALSRYLLVFKTLSVTANGKTTLFAVRVVADDQGSILRLTTTR